jgi:hypothetical protein
MSKSSQCFLALSILLLLCGLYQPAPALAAPPAAAGPTSTLLINNQSGANLTLTLSGPASYYFPLGGGKTKVQVARGKYQYRYYACGAYQSGDLEVKKANQKFLIKKCAAAKPASKPANTVKVNLVNDTGGVLTITLSGANSYTFTVAAGKAKLYLVKGKYTYTVRAICGVKSGTVNIRGGLRWRWWCF